MDHFGHIIFSTLQMKLNAICLDTLKIMRYARTKAFKYSFFNRVVGTWNSLPLSIREATSVDIFKALVRKFFMV